MAEFHVSFRRAGDGYDGDIVARVSDEDDRLLPMVETIRSQIVARSHGKHGTLDAVPNGHFMEIEFFIEDEASHGVVFMTPYLPDRFVELVRGVLMDVGIEDMM